MPRNHFGGTISPNQLIAHFWTKVNKNGPVIRPELGPCWVWTDYRKPNGYGQFYVDRKPVYAHRFICEVVYGPLDDRETRHKCDNGSGGCVRPSHLLPGTHTDNMRDMRERGRSATSDRNGSRTRPDRLRRGSAAPRAKLDEEQVQLIRAEYREGGGRRGILIELGEKYGVTNKAIWAVVHGKNWRHVQSEGALR